MSDRKAKVIAFFNNKGGVSKTTTCFNLGWMLAKFGKKVVMIDADPQCNLTGMSLEVQPGEMLPNAYRSFEKANLYTALLPALKSTGEVIKAPECVPVAGVDNLKLLPGNVRLAEVETQLATAMNVGSMMPAMQNVPGSFDHLFSLISEENKADYILIDLSPSLGALNQVNLLNSDFFIVPMLPDVFSVMAVDSLSTALPGWIQWAKRVKNAGLFNDPDLIYPFEPREPKFLGTILQRFKLRSGKPTKSFDTYFKSLEEAIENIFIPAMEKNGLLLDKEIYKEHAPDYRLANIQDFNSLIATAQQEGKPVFELSEPDLHTGGQARKNQINTIKEYENIFKDLAKKVIGLTDS